MVPQRARYGEERGAAAAVQPSGTGCSRGRLRSWPRTSALALLFSLTTLPVCAQISIASSAAGWYDAHPESAQTASSPAAGQAPAAAHKDEGHFPLVLGAFLTAASADLAVSMYQIGRGAAREAAFGSGWDHAPLPFALSKSGASAVFALGIQHMHKDRPKAAFVIGLSATIVESMLVARAARMR